MIATARFAAAFVAALVTVPLVAGCDARPDRPATDASAQPGGVGAGVDSATADSAIAAQERALADSGSWRPLAVPSPTDPDTYPLLIFNPHRVPLAVLADGGAGEVLLDTVAAGGSARVNLLIGADSVTLRAVGPDGRAGRSDRIGLVREPGTRWEAPY